MEEDKVLESLIDWQEENYDKIEEYSEIRVFNAIGTLVTLVNGGLMDLSKAHEFLTEVLSLDTDEKENAYQVFTKACEGGVLQ